MTPSEINEVAGVIVLCAAIPAHANVIIYGFGSRWWKSPLGVVLFAKWLSVALALDVVLARRAFGDYVGYEWVAVAVYTFVLLAFAATTVELVIERRAPSKTSPNERMHAMPDISEGGQHEAVRTTTVPEIWYKTKRVVRTIVQALLAQVTTVLGVIVTLEVVAPQLLDELAKVLPAEWVAWLAAAIATASLVAGAVARIMAIPQVNAWLVKLGLGSVPGAAVSAQWGTKI